MTTVAPTCHAADIAAFSIASGLCTFSPIPFTESAMRRAVERRMARVIASRYGALLSPEQLSQIVPDPHGSLFGSAARVALFIPLRRLFRRIFKLLAWNAAIDNVSRTYHLGYLLAVAGARVHPFPDPLRLHEAITTTTSQIGVHPIRELVRRALRGGYDMPNSETSDDVVEALRPLGESLATILRTYANKHFAHAEAVLLRELGVAT